MDLFLRSFVIGFTAAVTLGPIAVLCIQRTLRHGWRVGVASGVGVALADGLYGLVGALGLTAVTSLLIDNQLVLRVIGGVVLIYLGVKAFLSKPPEGETDAARMNPQGLLGAATSIFLLTLSNPMTILFFSAVYAGLGGGDAAGLAQAAPGEVLFFPLGVFAGSFTWWVVLASLVSSLRTRFRPAQLVWLNRVSGLIIAGFGVWVLVQGIRGG